MRVAVSPAAAFAVFTEEIDLWWRTGPRFRLGRRGPGRLHLEPGVGGRLFETFPGGGGPGAPASHTVVVGRVTRWDPPAGLALEWRSANFQPGERTFVEVAFEAAGEGTLVTVHHHGWSTLPGGHPARHGREGAEVSRMIGRFWGDLLSALREHLEQRRGAG